MREDATWARLVMVTSALKGLAIKIMGNVGNYTIVHWKRWKPWNLVTAFLSAKIQKKYLFRKAATRNNHLEGAPDDGIREESDDPHVIINDTPPL